MTNRFVRTDTVLDRILDHKIEELATRKTEVSIHHFYEAVAAVEPPHDLVAALRRDTVALIAEVKHASPSKGVLITPFDPVALGRTYADNGAAAISVLTDQAFFQGGLNDLAVVRAAVALPVLRKDFVLDPYQVYEGRAAGADAILLIVAALDETQLADLYALISELGMAALVEVHNEAELERALALDPALVGINNRDLKTFEVNLDTTRRLASRIPADITIVAESGIFSGADVQQMGHAGVHAVLVGEALVRAQDRAAAVRELSSQRGETKT